jgi:uncharacterized phage protein gp47/JayE
MAGTIPSRDRRARLRDQVVLNGIDFVEIADPAETILRVHFLGSAPDAITLSAAITAATITGGQTIPTVRAQPASTWHWDSTDAGRPFVELRVDAPGDFSTYTLRLESQPAILDPAYDHVAFSFKAGCPSRIDCEDKLARILPDGDLPPIDYLAKDFDSFRRALSDFSVLRYPAWQERSEADFGVMFLEALASVADDLSYQQDRIAAEAWLETATQRRSLVQLARLVDYEPRVATTATTMLQFQMAVGGAILPGVVVGALAPDGSLVEFETGTGLLDHTAYTVDPAWNEIEAYWLDDKERCLPAGATEMQIIRPAVPFAAGDSLLVEERSESPADPPQRAIVQLDRAAVDELDPLFGPAGGTLLARIHWRSEDALPFGLDLARTVVRGNLVPATHGRRHEDRFVTTADWSPVPGPVRAVVRTGPNGLPRFLHTLRHSRLAWLAQAVPDEDPLPEVTVAESGSDRWYFRRRLLAETAFDQVFTIEPARYTPLPGGTGAYEYDGDDGDTLRFGDGIRGAIPADGSSFVVTYRVGGGERGNVAADTLTRVDAVTQAVLGIAGVSNPRPATGGRDEEPAEQVRELAPHAFRAVQQRAVRPEDYDLAVARTLPWVQRAGTRFRYTGSWLSIFTAVDPRESESLSGGQAVELAELLDRYRMAGYEAYGLAPRYASLDISIKVCARSEAFRGDVEAGVLAALHEFFQPDRFTFGVPLERSALEAAVQDVPGIDGVTDLLYRRRGHTSGFVTMLDTVEVAVDEIVRADNDPSRPDAGSFRVEVGGGK